MHHLVSPLSLRTGFLIKWVSEWISYYSKYYYYNFRLNNLLINYLNSALFIKKIYKYNLIRTNYKIYMPNFYKKLSIFIELYKIPVIKTVNYNKNLLELKKLKITYLDKKLFIYKRLLKKKKKLFFNLFYTFFFNTLNKKNFFFKHKFIKTIFRKFLYDRKKLRKKHPKKKLHFHDWHEKNKIQYNLIYSLFQKISLKRICSKYSIKKKIDSNQVKTISSNNISNKKIINSINKMLNNKVYYHLIKLLKKKYFITKKNNYKYIFYKKYKYLFLKKYEYKINTCMWYLGFIEDEDKAAFIRQKRTIKIKKNSIKILNIFFKKKKYIYLCNFINRIGLLNNTTLENKFIFNKHINTKLIYLFFLLKKKKIYNKLLNNKNFNKNTFLIKKNNIKIINKCLKKKYLFLLFNNLLKSSFNLRKKNKNPFFNSIIKVNNLKKSLVFFKKKKKLKKKIKKYIKKKSVYIRNRKIFSFKKKFLWLWVFKNILKKKKTLINPNYKYKHKYKHNYKHQKKKFIYTKRRKFYKKQDWITRKKKIRKYKLKKERLKKLKKLEKLKKVKFNFLSLKNIYNFLKYILNRNYKIQELNNNILLKNYKYFLKYYKFILYKYTKFVKILNLFILNYILMKDLKKLLTKCFSSNFVVLNFIFYFNLLKNSISALFLAEYIKHKLIQRNSLNHVFKHVRQGIKRLKTTKILGYKILVTGRPRKMTRSRKFCLNWGILNSQLLKNKLDYAFTIVRTKFGICGIKVWINKNN